MVAAVVRNRRWPLRRKYVRLWLLTANAQEQNFRYRYRNFPARLTLARLQGYRLNIGPLQFPLKT